MVRRQDPCAADGPELGENERIDLDSALAMYTRNAAYVMRLEQQTGMLRPGMLADLVVLDRNLFDLPPAGINEAQVELTMVGGEVVFERD